MNIVWCSIRGWEGGGGMEKSDLKKILAGLSIAGPELPPLLRTLLERAVEPAVSPAQVAPKRYQKNRVSL